MTMSEMKEVAEKITFDPNRNSVESPLDPLGTSDS